MTAPNLNDRAERAAYARELRAVARPVRLMGVGLVITGAALTLLHRFAYPAIPVVVAVVLVVAGALHMLAAIAIRSKYHQQRMREGEAD